MSLDIEVLDDPARACSAMLLGPVVGGADIVLTGGSTPRQAYSELAKALNDMKLDPSEARLWFSDERCVDPEDDLSNYGLVRASLLDQLRDLPPPEVMRIPGEKGPEAGARDYEQDLRDAGEPRFELVLLGLGPDAHIASLFPHQATLNQRAHLAVGVPEAGFEPFVPRVSLTLPTLANAEHVVFLVTGESKARAVAAAFGGSARPDPGVPASMLVPLVDQVTVLLDPAAASAL